MKDIQIKALSATSLENIYTLDTTIFDLSRASSTIIPSEMIHLDVPNFRGKKF